MASEWQCGACTFSNRKGLTKCEMCNTNKGSSSRKNASSTLRKEQEAMLARLAKKPKPTPYKRPSQPKPEKRHHSERGDGGGGGRSSSSASAAGAEDDAIVKHSITEQGRTIIIYGSRQATANFGLNIGTSHLELGGKRSKKRGL